MTDVDIAIVGAGGAGLAVLHELALASARAGVGLRVALVDDVDRLRDRPDDRTWCFWDRGSNPAEKAVSATWRRVAVRSPAGQRILDLAPFQYAMLRAPDYYGLVADAVREARDRLDVVRLPAATTVQDGDPALVRTASGDVSATWVLDSRPSTPPGPPVTALAQHFTGAYVRTARRGFDPQTATLMDFRTAQPGRGLSFGYVLPLAPTRALVEYTEFSPLPRDDQRLQDGLFRYVRLLGHDPAAVSVEHTETGSIPMTDARHSRRRGRRVMLLGTAGGATRPATGYTFRTLQRQAAAVVRALLAGREPLPPRPYPRRHVLMDAAVLRALDAGRLDGPAFFWRLFERNPPARVLEFLDGTTGPASEIALMASAPVAAMLRSGGEAVLLRALVGRRRERGL